MALRDPACDIESESGTRGPAASPLERLRESGKHVRGQAITSIEHLEQNVAAASLRLSDEEFQKLFTVPALAASR